MFKSNGYFKSVPCPIFLKGSCRRPYCHFRHVKVTAAISWPKDLQSSVENDLQVGAFPLDDIITTSDWASGLAKDETELLIPTKPAYSVSRSKTLSSRFGLASQGKDNNIDCVEKTVHRKPENASDSNSDFYDVFGSDSDNDIDVDECQEDSVDVSKGGEVPVCVSKSGEVPITILKGGEVPGSLCKSGTSTDEEFEQFVTKEVTEGEKELQKTQEVFWKAIQSSSVANKKGSRADVGKCSSSTVCVGPVADTEMTVSAPVTSREASEGTAPSVSGAPGMRRKRQAHSTAPIARDAPEMPKRKTAKSNVVVEPGEMFMGKKRTSHQRETAIIDNGEKVVTRPRIPLSQTAKVPCSIRQRFLDSFIDEYLKMSTTEAEAYQKASADEKLLVTRATNRMLYTSLASNHLRKLRNSTPAVSKPVSALPGFRRKSSTEQKNHVPSSSISPVIKVSGETPSRELESKSSRKEITPKAAHSVGVSKVKNLAQSRKGKKIVVRSVPTRNKLLPQGGVSTVNKLLPQGGVSTANKPLSQGGGPKVNKPLPQRGVPKVNTPLPQGGVSKVNKSIPQSVSKVNKPLQQGGVSKVNKSLPQGGVSKVNKSLPQGLQPVGILYTVPGKEGQYFISHDQFGQAAQPISHAPSSDLSQDLFGSSGEED